jgi:non-canonical poly(A) RNA polymerase PAPD5/7
LEGNWKNDDFVSFGENAEDESDEEYGEEGRTTASAATPEMPPWMDSVPERRVNPLVALHNEIVNFCELMSPLPEEIKERQVLVQRFKQVAFSAFGANKCKVEVFGSQATGLFLPSSDIDLVILFPKNEEERKDEEAEKREMEEWDTQSASPLHRLATALRDEWRNDLVYLEVIENTRVPLVKFTHSSDVSFDVCFYQETGPKAAVLMKTYMDALPPLRPLTFVLKYFMDARGINEPYSGGVGSFMLQLMIVSFLQHRERDGYNFRRPSLYNLGALLLEFFELYGLDFNYVTTGISVRHDGYYFPKGSKDRNKEFWQPNRRFSMAIENPLEPLHDVGKPSYRIQVVQRAFELAFKTLLAHVSEPMVPAISSLASILPPTAEMDKRVWMKLPKADQRNLTKDSDMETSSSENGAPPAKRRKL